MEMRIEIVENGFIVTTGFSEMGREGEQHVYNTPHALAAFIEQWGISNARWMEAIESNEDDEWISVSDRLPTPGTRVKTKGGWCEVP
ncbi:MAG: hypothetical protein GY774_12765, partial [Planctomycetes bacterium]|nr:hypothetical protein [Planctomycetota bacterium]